PDPDGGAHAFICDGYNDAGMFHFNWGWGGSFDGYFQINNLNPGKAGVESQYNCFHEMIKGVRPMPGQGKYFNLNLDTPVTLLSDVIQYEDPVSVTTRIRNNGSTLFTGSLGAAIFDTNQVLIGFVELDDPATIQPGERYGVSFQNSGLPAMLPGKYLIGIMYKTIGDGWKEVNDTLTYINFPLMEVINPDVIEMASAMTVLPAVPLIEYKAASVKLEIRNTGGQDFSGTLNLAIHDIDGNYLYSLAQKSNFTLPAGSSSGQLTFSTNKIPVYAGSYLLALWYKPSAKIEYDLVGSTGFGNPVKVQVDASPLVKDSYEPNDSLPIATILPLSFSGNKATVKTVNANCHVGTDVDMYKIQLPMGNSYTIDAKLRNSDYDTTLTRPLNGFLSYWGPQDTAWYYSCNNLNPPQFVAKDGGELLFLVETNFIKQTGMYQLEIEISKNPLGIEESDPSSTLVVYPNPSSGTIYLVNKEADPKTSEIIVRNIVGTVIYNKKDAAIGSDPFSIDLSAYPSGMYFVTIREGIHQQRNIKISIAR
ncbi:MAG: T9SS type A sorting domain-containing protein, partial [bacterium]